MKEGRTTTKKNAFVAVEEEKVVPDAAASAVAGAVASATGIDMKATSKKENDRARQQGQRPSSSLSTETVSSSRTTKKRSGKMNKNHTRRSSRQVENDSSFHGGMQMKSRRAIKKTDTSTTAAAAATCERMNYYDVDKSSSSNGSDEGDDECEEDNDTYSQQPGALAIYPYRAGGDGQQQRRRTTHMQHASFVTSALSIEDDDEGWLDCDDDGDDNAQATNEEEGGSYNVVDTAQVFDHEMELDRRLRKRLDGIPQAVMEEQTEEREKEETEARGRRRMRDIKILWMIGISLIAIVGLSTGLVSMKKASDSDPNNSNRDINVLHPTISPSPTPSPTNLESVLRQILYPISGDLLYNESSYQYQALNWLLHEDEYTHNEGWLTPSSDSTGDDEVEAKFIERYIIVLFYLSTSKSGSGSGGWYSSLNFMNTSRSVCDWNELVETAGIDGVQCGDDNFGLVRRIHIVGNNLNGTIPNEIASLQSLVSLRLRENWLQGTIPTHLGSGPAKSFFRDIDFSANYLTGTVPESLSGLPNLENLILSHNRLTGTLPRAIFETIEQLEFVELEHNFLSGLIPEFVNPFNTSKMKVLFLNGNLFNGTLPDSLYTLQDLTLLSLVDNWLTGTLPSSITNLDRLRYLYLDDNIFTGHIPTEIGSYMSNLVRFEMSINIFSGTIPTEFGAMERLESLDVWSNYLSGTFPAELANAQALNRLDVSWNDLTGSLPSELSLMTQLEFLDIGFTKLVDPQYVLRDGFCNNEKNLFTEIWANCAGNSTNEAFVDCPCCVLCADAVELEFAPANYQVKCEIYGNHFDGGQGGIFFDERRHTMCTCSESLDPNVTSSILSCQEATSSCPMCNADGTVCAINAEYGFVFNEYGSAVGFRNNFQYISEGFNNTNTTLEYYFYDSSCTVSVNGQQCRTCAPIRCIDGFRSLYVVCDNLEKEDGGGVVSLCEEGMDDESIFGNALAVYGAADVRFRSGCEPIFIPVLLDESIIF